MQFFGEQRTRITANGHNENTQGNDKRKTNKHTKYNSQHALRVQNPKGQFIICERDMIA